MLAPVLTLAQTQSASRPKALYLGAVDVLTSRGATGGNNSGVPIESIHVSEEGAGNVSSMTFVIDDPQKTITISDGMDVRYMDSARDYPIFVGWVQQWTVHSDFGTIGRQYIVTAQGPEALLDWAVVPSDVTFALGTTLQAAVQGLAGVAVGIGPLRALSTASVTNSSIAAPVAGTSASVTLLSAVTVSAGTTLREGIRQLAAQTVPGAGGYGFSQASTWTSTVDMYFGLRLFADDPLGGNMAGLTSIFLTAGDLVASPAVLEYTIESSPVRAVVVKGTGVTVLIADGSGLVGQTAVLSDSNLTTLAMAQAAGVAYLAQFAVNVRGSVGWQSAPVGSVNTSSVQIRPGSTLQIIDASVGLAGEQRRIFTIERTYTADGREDWTMSFGGAIPSAMNLLRRLTRGTLS